MQVLVVKEIMENQPVDKTAPSTKNIQRKYTQTLVQLSRSKNFQQGQIATMLKEITEAAAQTLSVERVSIWLLSQNNLTIDCIDLYNANQKSHTSGESLLQIDYPLYYQNLAQERGLAVCDAINDIRTQELSTNYLSVNGIVSLLHSPIWLEGNLIGVVCHEDCSQLRQWTADEENFAASIADFVSLSLEVQQCHNLKIEIKQLQEAAQVSLRAKNEFLATMSHELRTPLNAIIGLSHLLQQEFIGSLNRKQKEYIQSIYKNGENLLSLINDILDFSKLGTRREELSLMPVLVKDICNDVLSDVSDRAIAKGLNITWEIDPQVSYCLGDERRMKQMLLHLLTNAIKFTPAGEVSLIVKKQPQGITFTVSDTGIGIDSHQLQYLFEPFKQLDSKLNRQYEGSGLGLALTRKLARLHGGDVTVISTLGVGSQFTLFLPEQEILVNSLLAGTN